MASSTSGSWSNIQPEGSITVGAYWSASCVVSGDKVKTTVNVTFKSVSGDVATYAIYADGKSQASHYGTHYSGTTKTLTYEFTESVAKSKTVTKSFGAWVKGDSSWTEFGGKDTTVTLTYDYSFDYTVSYNANGGQGTMSASTAYKGEDFLTRKNSFTRYGYLFTGWNEKADGTGGWWNIPGFRSGKKDSTSNGSSGVYETGIAWKYAYENDLTLYAQWLKMTVEVTFNSNTTDTTVVNNFAKQTYEAGAEAIYFKGTITRKHYNCIGWSTISTATVPDYSLNSWVVNEFIVAEQPAVTLYAVWKLKEQYTLSFNGTTHDNVLLYDDDTYTLPTTAPTKANLVKSFTITYDKVEDSATISRSADKVTKTTSYTFKNWNTKSDGSGTSYSLGSAISISSNTTLYTIFTSTDSWSYADNSTQAKVSAFPTGSLEQMTLTGWLESKESSKTLTWNPQYEYDITLYALWSPDGTGGFLKYYINSSNEPELHYTVGSKVRIVGLKDSENDGQYTIASYSTKEESTGKWLISLSFSENFTISGQQEALQKNVQIWGEGSYIPDFDYICAKDNRLWGCCSETRTIYASALGDPTDFWTFEGSTLDAYQVAVASANEFTGIIPLNSQIVFMKQHTIHKMLGSYPAEYSLYEYNLEGVGRSNSGSLVNMEGSALYLSEHGISSYSGTSVTSADNSLGNSQKENAVSMYNGEKYFLSFKDSENESKTYIYDTRYGIWVQEDYGEILDFIHYQDKDYVLVKNDSGNNQILKLTNGLSYTGFWEIVFKPFIETISTTKTTTHIFEKKRYTKLTLRLELPQGSTIKAEGLYDGDGDWHLLGEASGTKDGVCDLVISTPRVDKLQLKLSGFGAMTILAMERSYQVYSRR